LPLTGEEGLEKVSRVFDALGNPIRLRILLLVGESKRPLHIKAVARALGMDYAALYRQVKILKERNLIEIYEVGRSRVILPINTELLNQIIDIAKKI
jgi:DNA-binding transcriptional ArsR family regulator